MNERTPSNALAYGMRQEAAQRRIAAFHKRFGDAHLYLAYHAAFPLALTADLLYRLRANFQRDLHGKSLSIPWIAVSDLLLSALCEEVGYELYEMNVSVRTELLDQLKVHPDFGLARMTELSNFLLKYVGQQLNSHDLDVRDLAHAQYWTALAVTKPDEAAQGIALTLSKLDPGDRAEFARMRSLLETFAEPSTEFTQLLAYARGMEQYARGDEAAAKAELGMMVGGEQAAQVGGVNLPIPERLRRETEEEEERVPTSRRDFSISYHDADRAWAEWIAWQLEEDGYSVMLQAWDFQPGADFEVEMDKATKTAERIIVVYSHDYLNLLSTMPQWTVAFLQMPGVGLGMLLPIRVNDCDHETLLGPTAFLDLVGLGESEAREQLLSFVHREGMETVSLSGFADEIQRSVRERPGFPSILPEIFVSYVDKDKALWRELEKQLILLQRQGLIAGWHSHRVDRRGKASKFTTHLNDTHLKYAHIILLLISADYLASDYIWGAEVMRALEKYEAGEANVILIMLRPVDIASSPLGKLQVLPRGGKPITGWRNRSEAFLDIANGIRKAVEAFPAVLPPDMTYKDQWQWQDEGLSLRELGRYEEALAAYERAIQLGPQAASAYVAKGDMLCHLKRYEEALAAYDRAIELEPQFAYAYNNRGDTYSELEEYEKAISSYHAALQIYTSDAFPSGFPVQWANTQNNLGDAYNSLQGRNRQANLETAIICYQAALQVYTRDAFPTEWAEIQQKLGDVYYTYSKLSNVNKPVNEKTAIAYYEAAQQIQPLATVAETAIDNVFQEELFTMLAHEIVKFPPKQRTALLLDLANRMRFGVKPTPLQGAFLDVGIQLQDYQRPLPDDPVERSRHAALLSVAYKRLAQLPDVKDFVNQENV